jgi:hypothetical protein
MPEDDDEIYDVSVRDFDDVTELRLPESALAGAESQFRLHDAEANTLLYVTEDDDGVSVGVRDASAYADG